MNENTTIYSFDTVSYLCQMVGFSKGNTPSEANKNARGGAAIQSCLRYKEKKRSENASLFCFI